MSGSVVCVLGKQLCDGIRLRAEQLRELDGERRRKRDGACFGAAWRCKP